MFNFLLRPINMRHFPDGLCRYFVEREDGIYYSHFYAYKLASYAKDFFKDRILALDDRDNPRFTTTVTREIIDQELSNDLSAKYADKFRLLDEKWQAYRESHTEEFESLVRIASYDEDVEIKRAFTPDLNVSLMEAVQGYLCANELLKKYGKGSDEYEMLPKYEYKISLDEYKEKHANFKALERSKLGIPPEEDLTVKKMNTAVQMKRFKNADSVINSDEALQDFSDQFTEALLGE